MSYVLFTSHYQARDHPGDQLQSWESTACPPWLGSLGMAPACLPWSPDFEHIAQVFPGWHWLSCWDVLARSCARDPVLAQECTCAMAARAQVLDIWDTWQAGSCAQMLQGTVRSRSEDKMLSTVGPQGLVTLSHSLSASEVKPTHWATFASLSVSRGKGLKYQPIPNVVLRTLVICKCTTGKIPWPNMLGNSLHCLCWCFIILIYIFKALRNPAVKK